ncbi:tRNA dimethylallyltransferase-like [Arctopsyche grandis]
MAAARCCLPSRVPLVIILGSTGTGKTKLSLQLATKYQTEILSADSMQIYKGLDIITAKATAKERSIAPHHFLDILLPHQSYTVVDYRNKAIKIIDDLLSKNKIPIVVGGTNYYIESILWKVLIADIDHSDKLVTERDEYEVVSKKQKLDIDSKCNTTSENDAEATSSNEFTNAIMETMTSEDLHEKLKVVDPVTADKTHPKNKRKIMR